MSVRNMANGYTLYTAILFTVHHETNFLVKLYLDNTDSDSDSDSELFLFCDGISAPYKYSYYYYY